MVKIEQNLTVTKKFYIAVCLNLQNMWETALFSGKVYTADKNFTRPPVVTVATNSKSGTAMYSLMIEWMVILRSLNLSDMNRKGRCFYKVLYYGKEKIFIQWHQKCLPRLFQDICVRTCRLDICQRFYTTGFSGQKFYTGNTRKLQIFLLTIKQGKFQ